MITDNRLIWDSELFPLTFTAWFENGNGKDQRRYGRFGLLKSLDVTAETVSWF